VEEEVLAVVVVVYYDYGGGINKTKQQTVEGGTDAPCLHKQWGARLGLGWQRVEVLVVDCPHET